MTFGKHRGQPLSEVPPDYLQWCLCNCARMDPRLRRAIENELEQRCRPAATGPAVLILDLQAYIKQLYRKLALRHHPDRGGSHEAMKALNEFNEQMQDFLRSRS
jgi:hypothetical protein